VKTNLVFLAPVFSRSGYGEHAREILFSLYNNPSLNIGVLPTSWGATSDVSELTQRESSILNFTVNNHISPNAPFIWLQLGIPPEFQSRGNYNIGVTAGLEVDTLPSKWLEYLNRMQIIVVPTTTTKQRMEDLGVSSEVVVIPEGVDKNYFNPEIKYELPYQFTTKYNFLTAGQWIQQGDRKRIGDIIRVFCKKFKNNPEVGLIVKTFLTNTSSPDAVVAEDQIRYIKQAMGCEKAKIYLFHGDMTTLELGMLFNHPSIVGFITASSGEGWGRYIAEAIASGKPIAVPDWNTGYIDFIPKQSSIMMPAKLEDIPPMIYQDGLFERGMKWARVADEDIEKAFDTLLEKQQELAEKAKAYVPSFLEKYSKEVVQKMWNDFMNSTLKELAGH